jgi:hypothetical protein
MANLATVTSADFNGSTWDSPPFINGGPWLKIAIEQRRIRVIPSDRDYAIFEVDTPTGPKRALPGDCIQHMRDGTLRVAERPEKYRDPARLPACNE